MNIVKMNTRENPCPGVWLSDTVLVPRMSSGGALFMLGKGLGRRMFGGRFVSCSRDRSKVMLAVNLLRATRFAFL